MSVWKWSKYKKLVKYYNKQLQKCHKLSFNLGDIPLDYFVTYLRYLRDSYILQVEKDKVLTDLRYLALCTAIGEYELYSTCIFNYYSIRNKKFERIDVTKTSEEIDKEYNAERIKHWMSFWALVTKYLEDWSIDELILQNS